MPAFAYRAVDRSGKRLRGAEEAPSPRALTLALEARGLLVVDVAENAADPGRKPGVFGSQRKAVLEVTRAAAALRQAGLPLARALSAAAHVAGVDTRPVIEAVRERVSRGESLAGALSRHPALFSPLYVGVVRAGERSGDLAGAFSRLATQLDRDAQLRSRLLSLAIYTLILAGAGTVALMVLALFVLPRFAELLQSTGAALPRSTALVLAIANGMRHGWPLLLGGVAALPLVVIWSRQTDDGRRAVSRFLIGAPGVGALRRQALSARTARLLGVLVGGGAPLLTALDEARACLADPLAQQDVQRAATLVREGAPLHRAIAQGGLFH